ESVMVEDVDRPAEELLVANLRRRIGESLATGGQDLENRAGLADVPEEAVCQWVIDWIMDLQGLRAPGSSQERPLLFAQALEFQPVLTGSAPESSLDDEERRGAEVDQRSVNCDIYRLDRTERAGRPSSHIGLQVDL